MLMRRPAAAILMSMSINDALRQHEEGKAPKFEETLLRIVREELVAAG